MNQELKEVLEKIRKEAKFEFATPETDWAKGGAVENARLLPIIEKLFEALEKAREQRNFYAEDDRYDPYAGSKQECSDDSEVRDLLKLGEE